MTVSRRTFVSGLMLLPMAGRAVASGGTGNGAGTPANDPFRLVGAPRQGGVLLGTVPDEVMMLMLDDRRVDFAADGRFLIAFDRDARPEAVLRAETRYDDHLEQGLAVAPGGWRIEHVDAPLLGGAASSAEFQRRRAAELERIAAARAIHNVSDGWRQSFAWPVKARISGVFGSQRVYQGTPSSYHSGLDLAGGAGTVYAAPADGVVVLASEEPFTLEGKLLIVDHGMGLNSAFLHSASLRVKAGDTVRQGQPLGTIGATGRASGPHLHWSMKWDQARIDPLTLVESRSVG